MLVLVALVSALLGAMAGWTARQDAQARAARRLNAATQGWVDDRYRIERDGRDTRRYEKGRYE